MENDAFLHGRGPLAKSSKRDLTRLWLNDNDTLILDGRQDSIRGGALKRKRDGLRKQLLVYSSRQSKL